ncbi:hypothetical protein GTQ99_06885 [Kineococcus sp. T13]|uniref:hypothetical protein n=1 Tax=Kineococcus vitellinus TaxID=2696565 RepID=UPI001412AE7C|nr:hypothetical protein [Kineococcus vitellinus]NAZ75148.1 hypothetical protein [Kineococcus vitellinus]
MRIRIEALRVTSGSPAEARRLAQALPEALERALGSWPDRPRQRPVADVNTRRADLVAADVADAVHRRLGTRGGAA